MSAHPYHLPLTVVVAMALLAGAGCSRTEGEAQADPDTGKCSADGLPCTDPSAGGKVVGKTGKVIWAASQLYCDAPPIDVQTWLNGKPELEGKFVIIEFWRTWCGACKKSVPLLNSFQEKYGKELVVISITGEPEATVRAYTGPAMKYTMAIDKPGAKAEEVPAMATETTEASDANGAQNGAQQNGAQEGEQTAGSACYGNGVVIKDQGAMEQAFGVWGWPHVVLLEPEHRAVIWEGFPLLAGHELTAEKIEHALAVGRQKKAATK